MNRVGILGGGQLGRMLALAGYPLGMRFHLYDPSPESPAEHVAEFTCGDFGDRENLTRFADGLDVVSYEFENVPAKAIEHLSGRVPCRPGALSLATSQDRLAEKRLFSSDDCRVPTPRFAEVNRASDLESALARVGLPAVLKTRRGGYDGKGQSVLRDDGDVRRCTAAGIDHACIVESLVPFDRELSLIGVRDAKGRTAFYPLVQNRHADGILRETLAPAPRVATSLQARAEEYSTRIVQALDHIGVLTVEFFEVGGELLANEIAPRVHNSGHWTIEGAVTSQFENHLRAITGLPLGSTAAVGHSAMFNLIGTLPDLRGLLEIPGVHLHLYGKSPRPGRKLGHVTVCCPDERELTMQVNAISRIIPGEPPTRPDPAG